MASPSMSLSNLGKKRLYSQPFYDLLKTTKTQLSEVTRSSFRKKEWANAPCAPLAMPLKGELICKRRTLEMYQLTHSLFYTGPGEYIYFREFFDN